MIWAVLVLAILVVAEGLYILLRDPKLRHGRSIGITGVSSDRKVSPKLEEAPLAEPESIESGGADARTPAAKPIEEQPAPERAAARMQDEEVAKAQPDSPHAPDDRDQSPSAGADDWDAQPAPVPEPAIATAAAPAAPAPAAPAAPAAEKPLAKTPEPEPPASPSTDDWDAAPPPLEETTAPATQGTTPQPAPAGSDDWDAAPPPLEDTTAPATQDTTPEVEAEPTAEPEPPVAPLAVGADDWGTPPPPLDDTPTPTAVHSEPERVTPRTTEPPAGDDLANQQAREDTDDDQAETRTEQAHDIRGAANVSNTDTPTPATEPAPAHTPAANLPAAQGADDWGTPPPPLDDKPTPTAVHSKPEPVTPRPSDDLGNQQAREDTDDDQAETRTEQAYEAKAPDPTPAAHQDDDQSGEPGPLGPGSTEPADDGSGPAGWVKGDDNDMSFHGSDSPGFDGAEASVWFKDEATARNAGFRHWDPSKR